MLVLLIFARSLPGFCQPKIVEVRFPVVDKNRHIAIDLANGTVDVEGYNGHEIVITQISYITPYKVLEGFDRLNRSNQYLYDTVINYKVLSTTAGLFQIAIAGKPGKLHIKVPNALKLLSLRSYSSNPTDSLNVNNYVGPLQVEGLVKNINVSKVTGPFYISGKYGKISLKEIFWNQDASWTFHEFPYMVTSLSSDIAIFVPKIIQATFALGSTNGSVFSNLSLNSKMSVNGGGININAVSNNGNIYLIE